MDEADGAVFIQFDAHEDNQWVFESNHRKLKVTTTKRAPSELAAILVRQLLSAALSPPTDEGAAKVALAAPCPATRGA